MLRVPEHGIGRVGRRGARRLGWWLGAAWLVLAAAWVSAQTAPAPQALPLRHGFGSEPFATPPAGMAVWSGLNGGSISSETAAASSVPTADGGLTAATTAQSTGGAYGYARDGNGRIYVQTSSNTTNGVNQLVVAVDTRGQSQVAVSYDLEIVNAQPRTVGVLCQYRVGAAGPWRKAAATQGANPFSQAGGTAGSKGNVTLPLPAETWDQTLVQILWAVWRGSEGGNSSGFAIDNLEVSGTGIGHTLAIAVEPTSIPENGGEAAVIVRAQHAVAEDLTVSLAVADPGALELLAPHPAVIPAGDSEVRFRLRAVDNGTFTGNRDIEVRAQATGATTAVTTLRLVDDEDAWSPPDGHYATATGLSGTALKAALRAIAATGHRVYAYNNTFAPLRDLDADPANADRVITVYSGTPLGRNDVYRPDAGLDPALSWSREHLWPVSYGLDPEGADPGATGADAGPDYTDLFNLRPAVHTVNAQRGNLYYDESSGTPVIPPLAPGCSSDANSWEPRDSEKGDIARAMFYMATRYDGSEPLTLDLELANSPSATAGRFGDLGTLLQWHTQDPVSPEERQRNHLIFTTYQKNRNPFVDRPEFVGLIWGSPPDPDPVIVPAALPLRCGGPWSPLPSPGFAGTGTGTYAGSLGGDPDPGSLRFDDTGDQLTVAFSGEAAAISYRLKGNPASGSATEGNFQLLESADGKVFQTVRSHLNKTNLDEGFSELLSRATRFVRFLYQSKTAGNLQLDRLEITAVNPPETPYDVWKNVHFPSTSDPLVSGPDADPDGDGWANGLEFALTGDPRRGDDRPKVRVLRDGTGWVWTLAVRVGTPPFAGSPAPAAALGTLTYRVEAGGDPDKGTDPLLAVTPVVTGLPAAPEGWEYRSFRLATPLSQAFLRVSVTW